MVVTLLAFMVVLLMGLAAYTQIETSVAGNTQRQAQARENALFALNIAVGQLQRYAGSDTRATATAEAFPNRAGTSRYAGVWDGGNTETAPLTWLVSGNELTDSEGAPQPLAVTPTAAISTTNGVALVSANTSRTTNDILARLMPINVTGVPGSTGNAATTIGRYAWWVGDQGVKAPVAIHDRALTGSATANTTVNYAPYDATETRRRIRQQVPLGAGPASFEPRTSSGTDPNTSLLASTLAFNQLAFLKNSGGSPIGLATAQSNFHVWTTDNAAVLVNPRDGGLKRDLSLRPNLLGGAYAAWADYPAYMEDLLAEVKIPAPFPDMSSTEALRRRYRITPTVTDGEVAHRIAPVLSFCLLNFDSRTVGGDAKVAPIETRLRWIIGLWNPYSSALVPEDLRVEISGLPDNLEFSADGTSEMLASVSVSSMFGTPLRLALPWDYTRSDLQDTDNPKPDVTSWLPGRVYYWTSVANTEEPSGGNLGYFYSKQPTTAGAVSRVSESTIKGDTPGGWRVTAPSQLIVRVFRKDDSEPLGTYTSPSFEPFFAVDPVSSSNTVSEARDGLYEFSYLFRLNATAAASWLTENGRDPRGATLPDTAFMAGSNGPYPDLYPGAPAITNDDLLLERTMGNSGRSYNEDTPVFELPRGPLLSLAGLQHLHLPSFRPFAVGNTWGSTVELMPGVPANSIFDRFFLSGLSAPVTATADALLDAPLTLPLPNPMLQVLPRTPLGTATRLRDVLGVATSVTDPSEGYSSKCLLQRGAFNLNSVNSVAWLAVLRSTRYANGANFPYLNVSTSTGTAADASVLTTAPADAVFYRFPQSAQETYKADSPVLMTVGETETLSTYAASSTAPGSNPNVVSAANTHLFRRGMRPLSAAETASFATAIAARVRAKLADSGPFRSLEEFLAPRSLYANADGVDRSLLEAAIEDAQLNAAVAEFSSQWLTQADVMTALGPMLFTRSDTFVIRTYGEAVNPATSATEGRAWCEALVQRVPEYFETRVDENSLTGDYAETLPADLRSDLNKVNGRRFKVISFRWLSRSDI